MKIVNKEMLALLPTGTVFSLWTPNYIDGELHIKTGNSYTNRPSWNGELYLHPDPKDICDPNLNKLDTDVESVLWTTDNTDIDYNDDQLFVVFSTAEVLAMANALVWAAGYCKSEFNMEVSYLGNKIIPEKE